METSTTAPKNPGRCARLFRHLEVPALFAVPAAMLACAAAGLAQSALLLLVVVGLVVGLFFAGYEASRPALRQIVPTLVLASLGGGGARALCGGARLQAGFCDRHHRGGGPRA